MEILKDSVLLRALRSDGQIEDPIRSQAKAKAVPESSKHT